MPRLMPLPTPPPTPLPKPAYLALVLLNKMKPGIAAEDAAGGCGQHSNADGKRTALAVQAQPAAMTIGSSNPPMGLQWRN
jgi:hypothetical protein